MNCKECNEDLSEAEILCEQSLHDRELIDVLITCPECKADHNVFIPFSDFLVIERG